MAQEVTALNSLDQAFLHYIASNNFFLFMSSSLQMAASHLKCSVQVHIYTLEFWLYNARPELLSSWFPG